MSSYYLQVETQYFASSDMSFLLAGDLSCPLRGKHFEVSAFSFGL